MTPSLIERLEPVTTGDAGRVTSVQKEIIGCCLDWSAPFEIAARRRDLGVIVYAKNTRAQLLRMVRRGLLEHGKANDTFKATDAGRAALSSAKGSAQP